MRRGGPLARRLAACVAATGALLFSLANWHLFTVAERSQPDCVAHIRLGGDNGKGGFAAARSACTPR